MTLDLTKFSKLDGGFSYETQQIFGYISATDSLATISASGYFNDLASTFRQYDIIFLQTADPDVNIYQVTSATGAAVVTVASIIDTSIIPDNSVTLVKLAAGVKPSHVARFAGKHSYGGGGTSDAATVTGVVAGDIVFATIEASTNAVSITKAVPTSDTVTFHFSADPGAATVVSYIVFNAAS